MTIINSSTASGVLSSQGILRPLLLLSLFILAPTVASAATYYVAPSGNDANAGTITQPFATLQKAQSLANPGDTIYMRGGTYALATQTTITKNGSSGNYIKLFNYPGEVPILDAASNQNINGHSAIRMENISWWHIKGLEIKNSPGFGIYMRGTASNNIIENNNLHHNVRLDAGGAGITVEYGSNNLILNNDSHHNGKPATSGGDGVGVGSLATGNIIRGNRVWRNNDDGIDLWNAANVLVENNWSWQNGYNDALAPSGGNGNGFKLGGGGTGDGNHTIRNNLAWRNLVHGFDDNSANLPMNVFNNTSYENGGVNFSFYSPVAFVLKNNLSFPSSDVYITSPTVHTFNSWNLGVTVNSADFASVDFSGTTGVRQPDGSLPASNFLWLVSGCDLVDKGTNVGIAYLGGAPDLGAYEFTGGVTTPDTTAPTVPTGLTAVASTSQVSLSWNASTDSIGVTGYRVYRNGTQIAAPASNSYIDGNLVPGTYSYTVAAVDAAGNVSAQSGSVSATVFRPPGRLRLSLLLMVSPLPS